MEVSIQCVFQCRVGRLVPLLILGLLLAGCTPATSPQPPDPYAWLESNGSAEVRHWVATQNTATRQRWFGLPGFAQARDAIRLQLENDAAGAQIVQSGDHIHRLVVDAQHEHGLWEEAPVNQVDQLTPNWQPVLDMAALRRAEGVAWVWKGVDCLPGTDRCLVSLSVGGADAKVVREFDLRRREWVAGGFRAEAGSGELYWVDADTVLLLGGTRVGDVSVTGMPRRVRLWQRAQPLAEATVLFTARPSTSGITLLDMTADATPARGWTFTIVDADVDEERIWQLSLRGRQRVPSPMTGGESIERQGAWLVLRLPRETWVAGAYLPPGTLLTLPWTDVGKGTSTPTVLFVPHAGASVQSIAALHDGLVLNVLDEGRVRPRWMIPGLDRWTYRPLPLPVCDTVSAEAAAFDGAGSNRFWLQEQDVRSPPRRWLLDAMQAEPHRARCENPGATTGERRDLVVERRSAISDDGTRVPYVMVHAPGLATEGRNPVLMQAYGGFGVSTLPIYDAALRQQWLDKGGVLVLAQVRGGGEQGVAWHETALGEHRRNAYDDTVAIARDLIARRITSPRHLAIQGGSNGGLLAGNMLVHHPDLFGAVVMQVPVLDMRRYSALLVGAFWLGEYGDPRTEDWHYLQEMSPYHLVKPGQRYPPALLMTSTRDDRVHPGHARKMAARLQAAGQDVTFLETDEGGHEGLLAPPAKAEREALLYTFLWDSIGTRRTAR